MKRTALVLLFCWLGNTTQAQVDKYSNQRELRGSGNMIQEDQLVTPFQSIDIRQFISKVSVEVGGTQSTVHIRIDDNLKPFLQIESADGTLKLGIKDPGNKPFWLSKGTVDITIKTPMLNQLRNESNDDVVVTNLIGDSFDLTNGGNGNVTLGGTVKQLTIVSEANGTVNAQKLLVQKANVITHANATVEVNARQLHSQKAGNATVWNAVQANTSSNHAGKPDQLTTDLVTIILFNNSDTLRTVTLRFTELDNPTYGVISTTLGPYGKRRETYPVGTKIEQLSSDQQKVAMTGGAIEGKTIVILKTSDKGRTYNLAD